MFWVPCHVMCCSLSAWQFFVTLLGWLSWLSDSFTWLSDLQRSGMKRSRLESPGVCFCCCCYLFQVANLLWVVTEVTISTNGELQGLGWDWKGITGNHGVFLINGLRGSGELANSVGTQIYHDFWIYRYVASIWRCVSYRKRIQPCRLTWNIIMEVWKIIFLSKWVIFRFHVNLPGRMCYCHVGLPESGIYLFLPNTLHGQI